MKKLLYTLFAICLLSACSSDDNEDKKDTEKPQDYTSYTITNNFSRNAHEVVTAYRLPDGTLKLIKNHGTIEKGQTTTKVILDSDIDNIYVFFTSLFAEEGKATQAESVVMLEKKNYDFSFSDNAIYFPVTKNDPTEYPQE